MIESGLAMTLASSLSTRGFIPLLMISALTTEIYFASQILIVKQEVE